jgi:hypothetical protein
MLRRNFLKLSALLLSGGLTGGKRRRGLRPEITKVFYDSWFRGGDEVGLREYVRLNMIPRNA